MARLIGTETQRTAVRPLVLPRPAYYARAPYGSVIALGPSRGLRGLGDNGDNIGGPGDFSWGSFDPGADVQEGGSYVPPGGFNPTQVFFPSSSGGGFNIASLISNLTGAASRAYSGYLQSDMQSTLLNRGLYMNPATGQLQSLTSADLSSYMPLLLIGGGLLVLLMVMKK